MPTLSHPSSSILVINSGSSSLKAALFATDEEPTIPPRLLLEANATGIGQAQGKLSIQDFRGDAAGKSLADDSHDCNSQGEALNKIAESLRQHAGAPPLAIGHRIVHGGMHLTRHQPLTPDVLQQLEQAVHFAPLHIPASLELIRKSQELYPEVPQFACFDTAFHQSLPEKAWRLPIPQRYAAAGVRRYGFHGLSYESIVAQLRAEGPVPDRIVVAHLGSGSSLAALLHGQSVDTSMGFTPTGGIPMATRTGDLDPGVLIYLLRNGGASSGTLSVDELEAVVNHESGLSALSGGVSDMQKLEAAAVPGSAEGGAVLAINIFATAIAKTLAGYLVILGGIDLLVFTGGIGEHSATLRSAVVSAVAPLGLYLDEQANREHAPRLSSAASRTVIRVLPAQEDLQIARHVHSMFISPGV